MEKEELGPVIMGKLLNIGGMLKRKADQLLLPYNLNQQQFSILFSIKKEGRVKQKYMVNKLLLEKAHVSKIVKKLYNMGLIDITESKDDKRSPWLSITDKGSKSVKECQKAIHQWNREWLEDIDKERYNEILDNLSTLQNVFKENI